MLFISLSRMFYNKQVVLLPFMATLYYKLANPPLPKLENLCHPVHYLLPQQHMNLQLNSPICMIVGALGGRLITHLMRWMDA
jgi:hypothetical protein